MNWAEETMLDAMAASGWTPAAGDDVHQGDGWWWASPGCVLTVAIDLDLNVLPRRAWEVQVILEAADPEHSEFLEFSVDTADLPEVFRWFGEHAGLRR